ncbi:MAG: NAD-dependent epimerase/dehydratase family protein [Candidatus Eisenbacteria bacterium]
MKILVTGGTGFTGTHLVRRLLGEGHEVVALDIQDGLFRPELEGKGARVLIGDAAEPAVLERAVDGCEIVFHLAAAFRKINVPGSVYRRVNVDGTRLLLEACRRAGVRRFVYCSTQGVHGDVKEIPGDEDSPIRPNDVYQQTKWEGERLVGEAVDKGMPCVVLRPMGIYGPGDPGRMLLLFKFADSGRFFMFGDGETLYHPVYIDNFIDAFLLAMEKDEAVGRTYLVGDAEYVTLNHLVRESGRALGRDVRIIHLPFGPLRAAAAVVEGVCMPLRISPPLFRRRIEWYRQNRAFRVDRIRNELGFEPKVDLPAGLRITADWYRRAGYLALR